MRRSTTRVLSSTSLLAFAAFGFSGTAAAQGTAASQQDNPPPCEGITDPTARDRCLAGEVEIESGENVDPTDTGQTITVTGSRIRRPNLESVVPVTSVGAEELLDTGSVSLGDALNDLPALRSTFGTSNSQRFIGTTGLSLLDLRGLGTTRTLVLVNGRRHVTADPFTSRVDVNTIPFELLERVDVVTGGSSAVYGSDALAGVVNFILRRDYEGISLRGQAGVSERGDRGAYFVSGLYGTNFADGRGNIAVVGEYTANRPVFNRNRPEQTGAFLGNNTFVQTDLDDAGQSTDGIADNTLQTGVRFNFISEGGTVTGFCRGAAFAARQPLACSPTGRQRFFEFGPNGSLNRQAEPSRAFNEDVAGSSFQIGGGGSTLADYGTLFPEVERINVNVLANFEFSPAFQVFAEGKFARLETFSEGSPSFTNSFCGSLNFLAGLDRNACTGNSRALVVEFDNPFLTPQAAAQARAIQTELLRAFNSNATPQFFLLTRNNADFGIRGEESQRDTYRGVIGVEGDFNGDWRYEISATYGELQGHVDSFNNQVVENFRRAADAVRAPNGSIVCRVNADANPANDDPNCIPINVFGQQTFSPQQLAYINTTSRFEVEATQFDLLAFVSGDSSQLFELPGGPIGFVIGGEYRRETGRREVDPLVRSGATFLTAIGNFDPPALEVKEAFGELRVPLLRDTPFFHELELTAAGRISEYNEGAGDTGQAVAYNIQGVWAPIRDVRFRAAYSQAVRAPDIGSLFSEQSQNFAFLSDPCDNRNINNGPAVRITNCRSNTPLGRVPPEYQQPPGNRSILQGGNPLLEEETGRSITAGVVIQPSFVPGLSLTIDYYDITVDDTIAALGGNTILQQCYDSENFPNNQFCDLIFPRTEGGGLNPTAALTVTSVNFAKLTAQGVDFDLAYRRTLDNGDRVNLRAILTYNLERNNFLDPVNPEDPSRQLSGLGDPEVAANFNASYQTGPFSIAYSLRFIGEQTIGAFSTQNDFADLCQGSLVAQFNCTEGEIFIRPPLNPDAFAVDGNIVKNYPARFYHDLRFEFTPEEKFRFYFGVDNVTDQLPPFGLTGAGEGSGIFDNVGRYFYAGARIDF